MKRLFRALALVCLLIVVYTLYQIWPLADEPPLSLTESPTLATWLGVRWSMEPQSEMAIADLAEGLGALQVSDIFVYVSYLRPDGSFNPTYDHAANFVQTFKRYAPELTVYAWVGVPVMVNGSNRLAEPATRQQIADFAAFTVRDLGFDGFHLNAEPITNDDVAFLQMLDLLRQTLPDGVPLSTTSHALRIPLGQLSFPYPRITEQATSEYLGEIMARVDQVALMAYASGIPGARDYRQWVRYQTWTAASTAFNDDVEILIGLPVAEEWTPSHSRAERLTNALHGFQAGYHPRIDGVALYPYWDSDSDEWLALHRALSLDSLYNEP